MLRCRSQANKSSAEGRSHEQRSQEKLFARATWLKPKTVDEKYGKLIEMWQIISYWCLIPFLNVDGMSIRLQVKLFFNLKMKNDYYNLEQPSSKKLSKWFFSINQDLDSDVRFQEKLNTMLVEGKQRVLWYFWKRAIGPLCPALYFIVFSTFVESNIQRTEINMSL